MNCAFILLGTNIDRENNYLQALRRLSELGQITRASAVYETAPIGSCCENFYNGAVLLETQLGAHELKRALREIEARLGRTRTPDRNAPRTIDLDLVLFNHDQVDDGTVRLPDPLILERPFMVRVLAELDPEYVHPVEGRTLAQIANSLDRTRGEMRVQPAMTARTQDFLNHYYIGETYA